MRRAPIGSCGLLGATLALAGLAGCTPLPEFAQESLIDRPRVLAIVAEPPEVAPGAPSELSVLLALPRGEGEEDAGGAASPEVTASLRVCGAFVTMFRGSQYGDQPADQGCRGGFSLPLEPVPGEALRATLPGALTAPLFDDLELAAAALGATLPEATVEAIREQVGLALTVEAEVSVGERTLRAIKRVLVSESGAPHANPDRPRFDLLRGPETLAQIAEDPQRPFRCAAMDGETPVIEASTEIELAPHVSGERAADGGEPDAGASDAGEPWLEDYQVLNARGELEPRRERAFYSWFSTAGRFSEDVTKSPLRNTLWRAPRAPGRYPIWLVVRDGHGGTSACELEVTVQAQQAR